MESQKHETLDWDVEADSFDQEPDHGLTDPAVRQAWQDVLLETLPSNRSSFLDLGCGTGSITGLLAPLFRSGEGWDSSGPMIERAQAKNRHFPNLRFFQRDAFEPFAACFDLVFCRHLLWISPERERVLRQWKAMVAPGGALVLVEGFWHTGAGIPRKDLETLLDRLGFPFQTRDLGSHERLWGRPVDDERYAVSIPG